jgi:D-xylonolactonase
MKAEAVWPGGAILGEGPTWSARERAVYWVDVKGKALHRHSLAGEERRSWTMPDMIGWVVERRDRPGFIAGMRTGFAELTLDPLTILPIGEPEPHLPGNRFNDGKADAAGRIWAGTMDNAEKEASGAFYRLDQDLRWTCVDQGYLVPNGPTFSSNGRALFHVDSALRTIYRFDLDEAGELSGKRVHIRFEKQWGYPDGLTTDADGCLWIACWGGAQVARFDPDGRLMRHIPMPVAQPTSCVFAGENLDRMFVTSAAIGTSGDPLAGALFEIDPEVRGLPINSFAG